MCKALSFFQISSDDGSKVQPSCTPLEDFSLSVVGGCLTAVMEKASDDVGKRKYAKALVGRGSFLASAIACRGTVGLSNGLKCGGSTYGLGCHSGLESPFFFFF